MFFFKFKGTMKIFAPLKVNIIVERNNSRNEEFNIKNKINYYFPGLVVTKHYLRFKWCYCWIL